MPCPYILTAIGSLTVAEIVYGSVRQIIHNGYGGHPF